jgi:hypothetical protein
MVYVGARDTSKKSDKAKMEILISSIV